jgi:hypothetical protein
MALEPRQCLPSTNCTPSIKGQLANNAPEGLCRIVQSLQCLVVQSLQCLVLSCQGFYPADGYPVHAQAAQAGRFDPGLPATRPRGGRVAGSSMYANALTPGRQGRIILIHTHPYSSITLRRTGCRLKLQSAAGCRAGVPLFSRCPCFLE